MWIQWGYSGVIVASVLAAMGINWNIHKTKMFTGRAHLLAYTFIIAGKVWVSAGFIPSLHFYDFMWVLTSVDFGWVLPDQKWIYLA